MCGPLPFVYRLSPRLLSQFMLFAAGAEIKLRLLERPVDVRRNSWITPANGGGHNACH
jgi:hypothetical protein